MESEDWLDRELENSKLDAHSEQALEWLSRLATGDVDAAALAEFEHWRDSDPRHEKALIQARRLWLLMGPPLEARYVPTLASEAQPSRMQRRKKLRPIMAMAAALVLAVGIAAQWMYDWRHDYVTGVGAQRTVMLADGSTMWLNTDSAVDIDIDIDKRQVRLQRGEAYFDVRKNPQLPFIVEAGDGRIEVLGTAFAVRRQGDDVLVTVQRGKVKVSGEGKNAVVLTANQALRLDSGNARTRVQEVDAEQLLSWKRGRLQFENRPLVEVLDELRRYDSRYVLIDYPQAQWLRVSSVVDLARIHEWYESLDQSLPVQVTQIGPVVWIRQRPMAMINVHHDLDITVSG